jgi:sugar/nucleoside kinase (ribokinase family)
MIERKFIMRNVIAIGNAIVDSFLTIEEGNDHCRFNRASGEFCMTAGAKIPLSSAQFELGGNACNVAVALARLGLKSGLVAEIGTDFFAHTIKHRLQNEHIDLSHLLTTDSVSSFAAGIQLQGDRTLFVHHVERKHEFQYDHMETEWIYLSSMGENWRHVYREVPAFVKRHGAKLAFNPGTRQIAAGHDAIGAALAVTDILFLNKEEAEKVAEGRERRVESLSAEENKELIATLATKLQKFGVKTVVITDGSHGAYALEGDGTFHHQPVLHSEVVERTGAGDSYAAGFLAATIYGHDTKTAMWWGSLNAASVVGKVGAQPGLLTKDQIEKKIANL